MSDRSEIAGILLTGGLSSRMGVDKAAIRIDGIPQAVRLGELLTRVAEPVVEVGPGRSGLPSIGEEPPQSGPLVAIVAGARWLRARGHDGPALVLACDLPLLPLGMLELLATWPGKDSVLPLVDGQDQPLCARWSEADLRAAEVAATNGDRSLRRLPERSRAVVLPEDVWGRAARARELRDVDTRDELAALALGDRVELPDAS